jgi:hypothetical protein
MKRHSGGRDPAVARAITAATEQKASGFGPGAECDSGGHRAALARTTGS